MRFLVQDDYEQMSQVAADLVAATLRDCRSPVLIAATGATPTRTYELLGNVAVTEPGIFRHVHVVKLDEWGGLRKNHPATCETYLSKYLLKPWNISPNKYLAFDGNTHDPHQECQRVQVCLDKLGQIDFSILGMGINGHLGLNEPGDHLLTECHVSRLADTTRHHAMLTESEADTDYGLTLGMAAIFKSRQILLLVSGCHKRDAMQRLSSGEVTTRFPASLLWLHPNAICVCDRDAAAESIDSQ